jgi:16S rRNA (adenine1518-N6/adenine1519-N6)-dimethyltransferase
MSPKVLLNRLKLSPRKSLGQNFLMSEGVLDAIVALALVRPGDRVLEIGPGLGALTARLVRAGARVVALEKDRGLAPFLAQVYAGHPQVTIIEGDALEWDLDQLDALWGRCPADPEGELSTGRWRVVANLPYNVAIPILFRLLEPRTRFADLHVMVQKEVALRMAAEPDTSDYGILSISLGLTTQVFPVLDVPPASFYPAPKVQSAVVQIVPRQILRDDPGVERLFQRVVRAAFGERRKTLRNALMRAFDRQRVDLALDAALIDGGRRGETLSIEEFCRLSRCLGATGGDGPAGERLEQGDSPGEE